MKLVRIHPQDVGGVWALISDYIVDATATSNGRYDAPSVFKGIEEDRYQLWLVANEEDNDLRAVVVTQVLEYPTGLLAADVILTTGHHRKDWVHLLGELEEWARTLGCKIWQMNARKGWLKEFKHSHKYSHAFLERNL